MDDSFSAPGAGHWELDRSHYTGGTTPIMQAVASEGTAEAFRKAWPLLGIPAETLSFEFVNGFVYTRLRPLIAPDRPSAKAPPMVALKLVSRLHPEFRRRNKAAAKALAVSPSPAAIEEWHRHIKPRLIDRNLELQAVDLQTLDDAAFADHLDVLISHVRESFEEHQRLHCYDLGPIGQLLLACRGWGISGADTVQALAGASPSTSGPRASLLHIKTGLAAVGIVPQNLDDVVAASPQIAEALATYLRRHGSVLYAGYDLDSPTLGESPDVILATILASGDPRFSEEEQADRLAVLVSALRSRVPASERSEFDDLLATARDAMDLRDDNGPITAEWPCGLLRLALLEAGQRLAMSGRLVRAEHIFELDRAELDVIVRTGGGPSPAEMAHRAERRAGQKQLVPPQTLGSAEAAPPLDALPTALATMVAMVQLVIAELGMSEGAGSEGAGSEGGSGPEARSGLAGTGVGVDNVVGRARLAETAEEAFDLIESGDILVTRTTSPAYNLVLTMVSGLVTSEGGPLSHAAVLSRELGISAVVGARGALTSIVDGDTIEIDPVAGVVRVLSNHGRITFSE